MQETAEEERNEIRPMTRRLAQNVAATSVRSVASTAMRALVNLARNRRSAFVWAVEIVAHKSRWKPPTSAQKMSTTLTSSISAEAVEVGQMPGECWNCGQWLSGGDLLEGRCWNCKNTVRPKDGGYPNE